MQELETSGKPGDFSPDFKQYLKQRSEKYEKRKANLNKNWIVWTGNYQEKKLPPLEEKLQNLNKDLQKVEKQIEKFDEVLATDDA